VVVAGAAVRLRTPARVIARADWLPVTNFPDSVIQPALSPDGRMLAFLRGSNTFIGQAQVYVKILPDGEPVQLTHDDTKKMSPVFSPDGSRIAYTVLGGHANWDTWVVRVLGGTPTMWLPNASGLNWTNRQRLLFSEVKSGNHMAIVTSLESRAKSHEIYAPALEQGMAHHSYLSPDGKWVLIVEHDAANTWMPCRLVPFEGSSRGRTAGPPGICTSAAWSPDGKWMYFSAANPGDSFHIWRQRFPNGRPEQITSGPTEEEGIALSPDGLSLITAVALRQRPISFHDGSGDRQVSSEGYSLWPRLYTAGRKVIYRISRSGAFLKQTVEIWLGDLDSGQNEALLQGFHAIFHDISQDGRVLVAARDADNKPGLWLAGLDRRSAPRQIPGVESEVGLFAPSGDIIFLANEGNSRYLFRVHEDGTGRGKVTPEPISEIYSISPDGKWVAGLGPIPGKETGSFQYAYSTTGQAPVPVCTPICIFRWAPDGKFLYLSIPLGFMSFGAVGHTYVLPTRPASMFPDLPAGGFKSEAEIAAVPGVRVIDAADVDPGPSPEVYVFSREVVQRNLYRIPIP
jgi:eukaryotic-like serine/threonine-protein kinase